MAFPYFELVLGFYAFEFLFQLYVDFRQYQTYSVMKIPQRLKDVLEITKFQKSQEYNKDKSKFSFVKGLFDTVVSLVMLCSGIRQLWVKSGEILIEQGFSLENEILHSCLFVVLFQLLTLALGTPWSLYHHFVLEERHGFNKMTLMIYFTDLVKGILVGLVMGLPFLSGLLALIEWGGVYFWLYTWAFVFAFSLFSISIAPVLITPLFNTFTPITEGPLYEKIRILADRVSYPLTKIFQMDGSRHSAHSNAYLYGFFNNKRIVLFDTLVSQSSPEGIVAVVGHELGHWHHSHTIKGLVLNQVISLLIFYLFSLCVHNREMYHSFGHESTAAILGLLCFFMLFEPVTFLLGLLQNALSRHFEYQADEYAASLGLTSDLKTALITLQTENLSSMIVDPWYSLCHYTHPHLTERLSALDNLKKRE